MFESGREAEVSLAQELAQLVRSRTAQGRPCVLGLATGRTPVGTYAELVRMHREEGLDLSGVVTFNLDEFEGLDPRDPGSFRAFMAEHLFDHVNVSPANIHLLPSDAGADWERACAAFEQAIRDAGGIDLQVLGVGLNGHIGFNEPGSAADSRTRRVTLDPVTRESYARSLGRPAPTHALTMGIGTILEARSLRAIVLGAHKASIVAELLDGAPRPEVPASYLHGHPDVRLMADLAAASAGAPEETSP